MATRVRGNSVQVRHYVGIHPATGKRQYLERSIPLTAGSAEIARIDDEVGTEAAHLRRLRREQRWERRLQDLAAGEG